MQLCQNYSTQHIKASLGGPQGVNTSAVLPGGAWKDELLQLIKELSRHKVDEFEVNG